MTGVTAGSFGCRHPQPEVRPVAGPTTQYPFFFHDTNHTDRYAISILPTSQLQYWLL